MGAASAMLPIALFPVMFHLQHDASVDIFEATRWVPVMVLCSLIAGAIGYAFTDGPRDV